MKNMKLVLSMGVLLLAACSYAANEALLSPTDAILAVDADGMVSRSNYPGGEAPLYVLDANAGTKYLNFGKENSGFIVTPGAGASVLQSFTLTTAGDAPNRDPVGWTLWGTNVAIASADNSMGVAESWTLIGSGTVALPDTRNTVGPVVSVANSTAFSSYKMMYPTLKNAGATNSMQVADVSFFQTTDGTGSSFLAAADPILAVHQNWDSRYPTAENPSKLIDGTTGKYLNFGKTNTGFIVTPGKGMTIVKSFEIMTANDSAERDPASWALYGTNSAISSVDNSDGLGEVWTLIDSGTLALTDVRLTLGGMIAVNNSAAFASYKMLFPTLKDAALANSMQVAEIQFYGVPEPLTISLLGLGGLALMRRRS
jgi:hypothetical protein